MGTAHLFRDAPEVIAYPEGEYIFRLGDPGKHMFMVVEGDVQLIVGDRVVDTVGPGAFIGEMALIDDSPRSASARAGTAVRVFPIDENKFQSLVKETPFFAIDVMRTLAQRLRRVDAMVSKPAPAGSRRRPAKKSAARKSSARKAAARKRPAKRRAKK